MNICIHGDGAVLVWQSDNCKWPILYWNNYYGSRDQYTVASLLSDPIMVIIHHLPRLSDSSYGSAGGSQQIKPMVK